MHERIKKIRKELHLTQAEFADELRIKRGTISNYEIGRNTPIDAVISLICREFDVSEAWLRTGEGEMFRKKSRDDAIADFIADLMAEDENSFKRRFVAALAQLDSDGWASLEKLAEELKSVFRPGINHAL